MISRVRKSSRQGTATLLLASVWLACAAGPRFASPYYGPGGPPFISPKGHSYWRKTGALGARTPTHRVILIGDAGAALPDEGTLADLGVWSGDLPDATSVVFLGDNLYPSGLGEDDERGEGILLQQLRATRAKKVFVPGNHDWGDVFPSASTLAHEERFIDGFAESPASLLPKGGCPGPALETLVEPGAGLAKGVRLLAIDLDWWLIDADDRPACAGSERESDFVTSLGHALREHADDHVIVAAHHPLRTGGPHGGYGRGFWMRQLVGLADSLGIDAHDVDASAYRRMVSRLLPAFTQQPPLVYAAGHDHGLQVIEGRDTAGTLVVSGAGSARNITTVTAIAGTLFAHATPGFIVLDFYGDADFGDASEGDRVMLRVVETGRSRPVFEMELPQRP
jgi:hypothetical protein